VRRALREQAAPVPLGRRRGGGEREPGARGAVPLPRLARIEAFSHHARGMLEKATAHKDLS